MAWLSTEKIHKRKGKKVKLPKITWQRLKKKNQQTKKNHTEKALCYNLKLSSLEILENVYLIHKIIKAVLMLFL